MSAPDAHASPVAAPLPPAPAPPTPPTLTLTVLAPAHNEEDNVGPLVEQVGRALDALEQRFPNDFPTDPARAHASCEFVLVDDGSTDNTRRIAQELQADRPWLRIVAMTNTPKGSGNGQSAAFHAGVRAARGTWIALLDADLQNDPADYPDMFETLKNTNAHMVQGDRSHARQDSAVRRYGSIVGRMFRRMLLGDTITDTGCSLRIMHRDIALQLPLAFKGMHRFIPATARHMGYTVVETPVNHRARTAGETKYGMGISKRAIPGLIDLFAVRWMRHRRRPVSHVVIEPDASAHAGERAAAEASA